MASVLLAPWSYGAVMHIAGSPQSNAREQVTPELQAKLISIKRIYVDPVGDDAASKKFYGMLVSSFADSKLFIITENKDKADAVLKVTASENSHQEMHSLKDKAAAVTGRGAVATDDSVANTETINEASISARLVAADGDVVWTTTQESKGAKYASASADAASKVVKQLVRDLEKLRAIKASTDSSSEKQLPK